MVLVLRAYHDGLNELMIGSLIRSHIGWMKLFVRSFVLRKQKMNKKKKIKIKTVGAVIVVVAACYSTKTEIEINL